MHLRLAAFLFLLVTLPVCATTDPTTTSEGDSYPVVEDPHTLLNFPTIDPQFEINQLNDVQGTHDYLQYILQANEEALGFEGSQFVFGNQMGLRDHNVNFRRRSVSSDLLGPLKMNDIQLLDVNLPRLPLLTDGRLATGFTASSYPLSAPENFDSQDFIGTLPPGWTVELYRNDFLIDSTGGQNGQYIFRKVQLLYGENQFRLAFYGPHGERRDEYQTYKIDASMLRPGSQDYRFSYGLLRDTQTQRATLQYEKNIFGNFTLSVGAMSDDTPNSRYATLGLTGYFGGFLFNGVCAAQQGGGEACEVEGETKIYGASLNLKYDKLNNFSSEVFPVSPDTGAVLASQTSASLLFPLPFEHKVGLDFEVSNKQYADDTNHLFVSNTQSTKIGSTFLQNQLNYDFNSTTVPLSGTLQAILTPPDTRLSVGLNYNLQKLLTAQVEFQRLISPTIVVNGMVTEIFDNSVTQFRIITSKYFKSMTLALDFIMNGVNQYSVGLISSFSLDREPRTGHWEMNRELQAQLGSASVLVYLDDTSSGIFDSSKKPLSNVKIIVNSDEDNTATTDGNGIARIRQLTPWSKVTLAIDPKSLEDHHLVPCLPGVAFYPRPGKTAEINLGVCSKPIPPWDDLFQLAGGT